MGHSSGRASNHSSDWQCVGLAVAITRGIAIRPSKSRKHVFADRIVHFRETIEAETRRKLLRSIGFRARVVHRSGFAQVDD